MVSLSFSVSRRPGGIIDWDNSVIDPISERCKVTVLVIVFKVTERSVWRSKTPETVCPERVLMMETA